MNPFGQIRKFDSFSEFLRNESRGFTLVELLVVVTITGLLISLLFPAVARMKSHGNSAKCISNLRQIGAAFQLYAAENNNTIPAGNPTSIPGTLWTGYWHSPTTGVEFSPAAYGGGLETWKKITTCPDNITAAGLRLPYVVNYNIMISAGTTVPTRFLNLSRPSQLVLVADSTADPAQSGLGLWGPSSGWQRLANRHGKTANILWADGHVSAENKDALENKNFN